jgi:glucose-6-phosphate isomerase
VILLSREQTQPLTARPAWKTLGARYHTLQHLHLRQLFPDNPGRGECVAVEAAGIYLDDSKNRVTDETIRLLVQLAEGCGLRGGIDATFSGEKINVTESAPPLTRPCTRRTASGAWWLAWTLFPTWGVE